MNRWVPVWTGVLVLAVVAATALTTDAYAKKPKPPPGGCPRDIMCPDVWDPVICNDGQVYSNGCYAFRECATGCVPYDDGGPVEARGKPKPPPGGCPRDIMCPDVWDPVVCSDGQVYSNSCYAFRECATGCVPYDDGGPVEARGKPKPPPGGCPRDIMCPDVWDPVICDDGQVYSNGCYAYRECATGCVPYDDGGPVPAELRKKPGGGGGGGCPRDIMCPDVWDPVICDDGQVYSNGCYAFRECATGCVPYDDGGPVEARGKPGGGGGGCPRDIMCPDVWDPVICNDGQVYSNGCYAYRECATGCVPYGDGGPVEW